MSFKKHRLNELPSSRGILMVFVLATSLVACGPAPGGVDVAGSVGMQKGQSAGDWMASDQPKFNAPQNCHGEGTSRFCLALKYVVFADSEGSPAVAAPTVYADVSAMNRIWEQCKIHFQVDQLLSVDPQKYNLSFHSSENSDLDEIRRKFMDQSTLLVVTTGKWDRSGSLGSTGANAWTATPGESFYGVVLEAPVGDYPNIIAHELGHYLNLDHVSDTEQLMNPVIYDRSRQLTQSECQVAENAVQNYWGAMLR